MKRAGFTMIELIFVIVIIGILSAVALPKFLGVATQAHLAKVKSYVGTLNMTVGPALWSQSLSDGKDGNVTGYNVTSQIKTPSEITKADPSFTGALTHCGSTDMNGTVGESLSATGTSAPSGTQLSEFVLGDKHYTLGCTDGNASSAPHFWLLDNNTSSSSSTSSVVVVE